MDLFAHPLAACGGFGDMEATMRLTRLLIVAVTLFCWSVSAQAGDDVKIGTSGAQELRIPVGSGGTAMAGSGVAYSNGIDALYWNPAGAASVEGVDLMLSRRQYIADIDIDYLVAARPMGDLGVFGITAKVLSMGDEIVTTIADPDGNGETFSSSFSIIGLSWARTLTDRVAVGANGNVIYEKIADQTATGVAFDVGVQYNPGWNNMTFGAVIKNLGPRMRFDGRGFDQETDTSDDPNGRNHSTRTQSSSFEIPSYVQLGMAYKILEQEHSVVHLTGAFQSNNFSEDEFRFGAEYAYNGAFFLRGGYTDSRQKEYLYGFTAGAGLNLALGETTLKFDYAWGESDLFEDNQTFTFLIDFD